MPVNPISLRSRLQAAAANAGVEFEEQNRNSTLARRLIDADVWEAFSDKFSVDFDPESGQFTDIGELAYALAVLQAAEDAGQELSAEARGALHPIP